MIKLRSWQEEAFNIWKNKNKGTIQAVTGSGKSFLFLKLIEEEPEARILICVPTQALMYQHSKLIKDKLNIDCGLIGDGNKEFKQITVAVINSVRKLFLKSRFDILILDEAHRMMSNLNKKIFDNNFERVMLLSATIERSDGEHKFFMKDFPIIYSIGQEECIKQGWISSYEIINKGVELTKDEAIEYFSEDEFIKENFRKYGSMQRLTSSLWDKTARELLKSIQKRKQIVMGAKNKLKACAVDLLNCDGKAIVFSEYQTHIELLYSVLRDKLSIGIYHSGMKKKELKTMLDAFSKDEFDILLTCRALDEGLDVPACKKAFIIGSSSVERQFIQRTGRVLRTFNEEKAVVIQYYVKDTKDEDWLEERMSGVDTSIISIKYIL